MTRSPSAASPANGPPHRLDAQIQPLHTPDTKREGDGRVSRPPKEIASQ
jgi:hypothetical protein